jgi:hypothetical protein
MIRKFASNGGTASMAKTVQIERRQRGLFGYFFLLLFVASQRFMLYACVAGVSNVADQSANVSSELRSAHDAGVGQGMMMLMVMLCSVGWHLPLAAKKSLRRLNLDPLDRQRGGMTLAVRCHLATNAIGAWWRSAASGYKRATRFAQRLRCRASRRFASGGVVIAAAGLRAAHGQITD